MATDIVLQIVQVPVERLRANAFNPRKWSKDQLAALRESIIRFGLCDPLIANSASGREHFLLGGHMRLEVAKEIGLKEVPVVYIKLEDIEKERELCVRLNKNTGSFDLDLLKAFSEEMLADIGFDSAELDSIFDIDPTPEKFDLKKELGKLNIHEIKVQKGDVYEIAGSKLMCGDSTIEADMLKLMGDEKADMCFTDEPYVLDYLHGKKRNGKATTGFGLKRDRRYLETESIPDDFIEKWMANVAKVQKPDFSIIAFEHPKNLRLLWNELEKHWKYRGTIVWRLPNRMQGFSGKYKFFNKFDIAVVGSSGTVKKNVEPETEELFENEYQAALYATSGKPHWESYEKGKKYQPTDFVEFIASDAKSSGQGVIFGCKPIEILIPYIKVLTQPGALVVEPFGGSGSTGVACFKLGRRCYTMEKVPAYTEVIKARWEKLTGQKANKIS